MPEALTTNRDIFSISRLNMEVRNALENSFPLLWIAGEISNLATPASGHLYFSLKDAQAQVRAALFRAKRPHLRFQPQNGQQVLVRARVTLYEPRGDFQLLIEQMEMAGEGILRQQVEALRQRLQTEGLFDTSKKKRIPTHATTIGVMTSTSGAALHDVLTVLRRRNPLARVLVYPVTVQGASAAAEMTRMLAIIAARQECDLLLVTRGGGSFEDLMPFNDEQLVRALAKLPLPTISAIGHEVDTTLCDYVADQRAATPSAAAELASSDQRELLQQLAQARQQLVRLLQRLLQRQMQTLDYLRKRLDNRSPQQALQQMRQALTQSQRQLHRLIHAGFSQSHLALRHAQQRLQLQNPGQRIHAQQTTLWQWRSMLLQVMQRQLAVKKNALAQSLGPLQTLSPLATLERGYSIAFDSKHQAIRDARQVVRGDKLHLRFAQGQAHCTVDDVDV